MSEELSTYRKFIYKDDALELINILEENRISYELINNSLRLDSSFGGDINKKQYELKVDSNKFDEIDKLEEKLVEPALERVQEDYYLFDYTDEELVEIILKKDEWNKFDYLLAQKILKDRGNEIKPQIINAINKQRINDLSVPEENQPWLIYLGYLFAILGGFIGIFIGVYLVYDKKTLPNGEKINGFKKQDRNHGRNILIISGIAFIFWFSVRFWG